MRTLASELGNVVAAQPLAPRVYVDANVPTGLVAFMRTALGWDVLFVLEHDDLRRAPDTEHFRLAAEMRRTLVTLDRDYFDTRRFPPQLSGGVIVMAAPDEQQLRKVLCRVDAHLLRGRDDRGTRTVHAAPLAGQAFHAHIDWRPEEPSTSTRQPRRRREVRQPGR